MDRSKGRHAFCLGTYRPRCSAISLSLKHFTQTRVLVQRECDTWVDEQWNSSDRMT
jgi:hypothetical protein